MNIWCAFDMNENIVTRKFLTQNFANEINANYGISIRLLPLALQMLITLVLKKI